MTTTTLPARSRRLTVGAIAAASALAILLSGCSGTGAESAKKTDKPAAEQTATGSGPIEIENCGRTIRLEKAPERIIFQNAVGASHLAELNLLDKVVARSGEFDVSLYTPEQQEKFSKIPVMEGASTGHGHTKIATESILEYKPDLVVGYNSGLDRDKLEASGVPVYFPESYCPDATETPGDFAKVTTEVDRFGKLFAVSEQAKELNANLEKRITALQEAGKNSPARGKTAAVLFITPGDTSTISVYGKNSMMQAQLDSLGVKNVYESNDKRVTDVSIEDVLEKDPDIVVLLHTAGTPEEVRSTFDQIRGTKDMKAAKAGKVFSLPYPYVDPPSPLSVTGGEKLAELLAKE